MRNVETAGKSFLRMKDRERKDYISNTAGVGVINEITKLSKESMTLFGKNTGNPS
jgi:hypothetical protein